MFKKKNSDPTYLDNVIDDLYRELDGVPGSSDEYAKIADQLTKLYAIKELDSKKAVSAETLAMIFGNIAGILLIIGHERAHVVASKALGFVMKLR